MSLGLTVLLALTVEGEYKVGDVVTLYANKVS